MAHARAPLDGRDEEQKGQHGAFPEASLGLEGVISSLFPLRLFFLLFLFFFFDPFHMKGLFFTNPPLTLGYTPLK